MSAVIYPNVTLGKDPQIEEFVIIGIPPRGRSSGKLTTLIGDHAIIRSHTVIYAGNHIGHRFQTGHGALIREENEIGDDVSIGSHAVVEHHVRISNGVRIHSLAFIPEYTILEDECWIGPNAVLTNARYPLGQNTKGALKGPTVRAGAKIGANATLLPGVVIGLNALVGAGAVVVCDVPDGAVVVGNPARVTGVVTDIPAYAVRVMGKRI